MKITLNGVARTVFPEVGVGTTGATGVTVGVLIGIIVSIGSIEGDGVIGKGIIIGAVVVIVGSATGVDEITGTTETGFATGAIVAIGIEGIGAALGTVNGSGTNKGVGTSIGTSIGTSSGTFVGKTGISVGKMTGGGVGNVGAHVLLLFIPPPFPPPLPDFGKYGKVFGKMTAGAVNVGIQLGTLLLFIPLPLPDGGAGAFVGLFFPFGLPCFPDSDFLLVWLGLGESDDVELMVVELVGNVVDVDPIVVGAYVDIFFPFGPPFPDFDFNFALLVVLGRGENDTVELVVVELVGN